jgi:hypothetical protein
LVSGSLHGQPSKALIYKSSLSDLPQKVTKKLNDGNGTEWDQEAEKWSGGDTGGTDLALGFKGTHVVCSAWMAQNWVIGPGSSVIGSNTFSGKGPSGAGGLNVVEAQLEFAREYLSIVLAIAETRSSNGKLHPQTIGRLLTRHAAILEWMGPSQPSWFELRSQLERVWDGLHDQGIEAARAALKLGDLNHRLGDVGQGPSRSRTQTQTLPKRPKLHLQCPSHHRLPLWLSELWHQL